MDREPNQGEVLVIIKNSSGHDVPVGEKLVVCRVDDSDETFQGIPRTSSASSPWIPWGDAEPIAFGWEFARKHLPPDLERLLGSCRGIEFISLNSAVKDLILASLPDWQERVSLAIRPLEEMVPSTVEDGEDDSEYCDYDDDDDEDDDD
jgi:hypothetical protein